MMYMQFHFENMVFYPYVPIQFDKSWHDSKVAQINAVQTIPVIRQFVEVRPGMIHTGGGLSMQADK